MEKFKNAKRRWNARTPIFFRSIIKAGIAIAGVGTTLLALPVALPAALVTASTYMIAVGSTAAVISKFTKI